ncbi:MAG: hypothetical protein IKI08_01995 [Selenomonadaceae bacterium]|nr:hypothetical protein [Selenomonadaceae bacterium]
MKKFLIAAAATLIIFGGQVEAAPADDLNAEIETQDMGTSKWANFRDKYILGRETENERRDRKDWERRHRNYPPPPHYRDGHRYYPPPSPPPPPPHYRDGRPHYPPPPPPGPPPRYR